MSDFIFFKNHVNIEKIIYRVTAGIHKTVQFRTKQLSLSAGLKLKQEIGIDMQSVELTHKPKNLQ